MKLRFSPASLPLILGLLLSLPSVPNSAQAANEPSDTPVFSAGAKEPYPGAFKQSFGIDQVGSTGGLAPGAALSYSNWVGPRLGYEMQFFFAKAKNGAITTTQSGQSALGTHSLTTTTSFSGANEPTFLSPAFAFRYRAYQDRWLQIAASFMVIATLTTSSESPNDGSQTVVTTPDSTAPNTFTTTESGVGTTKTDTDLLIGFGPKLSTQFYLPWFPHLALGLSAGILAGFGGGTKSTKTERSRSFSTTNGTAAAPGADTTTTTIADKPAGFRAATYGVGGSEFSLFTTAFTLHYEW